MQRGGYSELPPSVAVALPVQRTFQGDSLTRYHMSSRQHHAHYSQTFQHAYALHLVRLPSGTTASSSDTIS